MQNLTNTQPQPVAIGDTLDDAATRVKLVANEGDAEGTRFDALWDAMNANNAEHVAPPLQEIAGDLMLFALNGYNGLLESFGENTGEAVKATRAAIALCRESLNEIELAAAEVMRAQLDYHRRELAALEAVI